MFTGVCIHLRLAIVSNPRNLGKTVLDRYAWYRCVHWLDEKREPYVSVRVPPCRPHAKSPPFRSHAQKEVDQKTLVCMHILVYVRVWCHDWDVTGPDDYEEC